MKSYLILLVVVAVSYECKGSLIQGLLTGALEVNSKVHDVAGSFLGGVAGALGGNRHQPSHGGYKPGKPTETIVVVVEEGADRPPYGPGYGGGGQPIQNGYGPSNNYNNRPHHNHGQHYGNQNPNNQNGNVNWNPNSQNGNPNHQHGNPNQYGNNNQQYGNPQNQNGRPNNQYGNPNIQNGRPNNLNGNPNNQYGNPNIQNGRPNNLNGNPNNQYGNPNNQNENSNNHFGYPNNQNGNSNNQNGHPNNQNGNVNNQNGYPNNQNSNHQYDNANNQNGKPNNQYDNPSNNYGNTNNQYQNQNNQHGKPNQNKNEGQTIGPINNINPEKYPTSSGETTKKSPTETSYEYDNQKSKDDGHKADQTNIITSQEKTTKKPADSDEYPLFVPLNDYVYGGDKIQVNAPKRDTDNSKPKPSDDDDEVLPLDVRIDHE